MWDYTPRRIAGFLRYADRRHRGELAGLLAVINTGARGDKQALKEMMKELGKP